MKKYSFSSACYKRKDYAFSTYQHPQIVHSYHFDADLQRVKIANYRSYSFYSENQYKKYDFDAYIGGGKTYDFECTLSKFNYSRYRAYHFYTTERKKQYHFDTHRPQQKVQYHFETWKNEVVPTKIVRLERFNIRPSIDTAELICYENIKPQSQLVVDAVIVQNDSGSIPARIIDTEITAIDKIEKCAIFKTSEVFEDSTHIENLTLQVATHILDSSVVIERAKKAEIFNDAALKLQRYLEKSEILQLEAVNAARQWIRKSNVVTNEIAKVVHKKTGTAALVTTDDMDTRKYRQIQANLVDVVAYFMDDKLIEAITEEMCYLKEIKSPVVARIINMAPVMHTESDKATVVETASSSTCNNNEAAYIELNSILPTARIIESLAIVEDMINFGKSSRGKIYESSRFLSAKRIIEADEKRIVKMIPQHLIGVMTRIALFKSAYLKSDIGKVEPINILSVDAKINALETIELAPVDGKIIEFDYSTITAIFDTHVVKIDGFIEPNSKNKPMWLIQNRPRWGAKYFTQIRR